MSDNDTADNDPRCTDCGRPRSEHDLDQRTLEPTKCPVGRRDDHVVQTETGREMRNMQAASIDGPACSHPFGEPHEAEYEERMSGAWVPVCDRHVDPTNEVREL